MNTPTFAKFITNCRQASLDLCRQATSEICETLEEVQEETGRFEDIIILTGALTACLADYDHRGNPDIAFLFSYDDEPIITSTDDDFLIPRNPGLGILNDLNRIASDFQSTGKRTWSGYDTHVTKFVGDMQLRYPGWGEGEFETSDTFVGDSEDVDVFNVVIRPPLGGFRNDATINFLPHMNENADFFKRLLQMGIPHRLRTVVRTGDLEPFRGGLLSARPITIHMFTDCRDLGFTAFGQEYKIYMNKDEMKPHEPSCFLTKGGFLCKDLDGNPFVILGVQTEFYQDFSILLNLRLALDAGDDVPVPEYRPEVFVEPAEEVPIDDADAERVRTFLTTFFDNFIGGRFELRQEEGQVMPLKQRALNAVMDEMVSIASRNNGLRCLQPASREKAKLVVISQGNMYLMSRLASSVVFGGTYYQVDEWVGHREKPTAAWIRSCGVLNGERVQPFRLMRADGTFVKQMIDFAVAFNEEEEIQLPKGKGKRKRDSDSYY